MGNLPRQRPSETVSPRRGDTDCSGSRYFKTLFNLSTARTTAPPSEREAAKHTLLNHAEFQVRVSFIAKSKTAHGASERTPSSPSPLARRAPEGQGVHRGWRFRSEGSVRAFIHQATEVPLEAKDGIWSQALGSSNRSGRADHVESTGHGQQLPASGNSEKISQTKLSSQAQEQGQTLRTGTRSDRQTSGFCFHT